MRVLVALIAVGLLAGCFKTAPKYWQHKNIPSSQWASDHRKCKRAADKYLGLNEAYHADQNISAYQENMRRYEVGKKQGQLVAKCMRKMGYVPGK